MEQARPEQLPPEQDSWTSYVYLAGRGAGKTRTAAEWICYQAIFNSDTRYAVIAPTLQDVIQTCVEGQSGILSILSRYQIKYLFIRSQSKIILQNSSQIFLYSAEEPNRLRGPQFHGAWLDELASFSYPEELYETLLATLRLGRKPKYLITTTSRSIPLLRSLVRKVSPEKIVVRGSTFDNSANLPASYITNLKDHFQGTRYERQELLGELIYETEGAFFNQKNIDQYRYSEYALTPTYVRKVLAVDPAVTWNENSAHTGIIVAGITTDWHFWVIEDGTLKGPPIEWASKAVELYKKHNCSKIVVETNNGGDAITEAIRQVDPLVCIKAIKALVSKELRFSPLSIMYEQGLVHHVGQHYALEEQMTSWVPGTSYPSPDRLDALVWAIDDLIEGSGLIKYFSSISKFCDVCAHPNRTVNLRCSHCYAVLRE